MCVTYIGNVLIFEHVAAASTRCALRRLQHLLVVNVHLEMMVGMTVMVARGMIVATVAGARRRLDDERCCS